MDVRHALIGIYDVGLRRCSSGWIQTLGLSLPFPIVIANF